jgi:hypothetical protein
MFIVFACYIFLIPFYLQSVLVHSANYVNNVYSGMSLVAFGSTTYKLNLKNYHYKYNNCTLNLVGRSFGRRLRNRLLSGGSMRFTVRSFGSVLRLALF